MKSFQFFQLGREERESVTRLDSVVECGNSEGGNDERIVMGRYRVTRFISDQAHIKSPVFILENKNTTFLWEFKQNIVILNFMIFPLSSNFIYFTSIFKTLV